jgi:RimJ/RimL family protein N-acetyltransferase
MVGWPPFEDPLYRLFDWPRRSSLENRIWYSQLVRDRARVYYAVDDEAHTLIGRISLREIYRRESARLGIGFGRDYVGQGYGTEALQLFLSYYFARLGFAEMVLDVSAINERAVRCYERCGFRRTASHYEYLGRDVDLVFLDRKPYRHLRSHCQSRDRRNWVLSYDMALSRDEWFDLHPEAAPSTVEAPGVLDAPSAIKAPVIPPDPPHWIIDRR